MKLLVAALLLTAGCATSRPFAQAPPAATAVNASPPACTLLGEPIYNPRSGIIDPLTTMGPSRIIWFHPGERYLAMDHGYLYECITRT
jgi:hypothetical protein